MKSKKTQELLKSFHMITENGAIRDITHDDPAEFKIEDIVLQQEILTPYVEDYMNLHGYDGYDFGYHLDLDVWECTFFDTYLKKVALRITGDSINDIKAQLI